MSNNARSEFRLAGMADIILAMGGNIGRIPSPLSYAATDIRASLEVAWSLLINIERWPDWVRCISAVRRYDYPAFRSSFECYINNKWIRSTIEIIEPRSRLVWTDLNPDSMSIYTWKLHVRSGGIVNAGLSESQINIFSRLYKSTENSEYTLSNWLEDFKNAAEKIKHQIST